MSQNYPLDWPQTEPRTPPDDRKRARFSSSYSGYSSRPLTVAGAMNRLWEQTDKMRVVNPALSSDIPTRNDGQPRSGSREPDDSGVCLYFTLDGRPYCFPCDRWDRVADNIAAIAAHINAMRGQERWGVGSLEKNFAGYMSLPAPDQPKPWHEVLGCSAEALSSYVERRYRQLARDHHPDNGGDATRMAEINQAMAQARASWGSA